MGSEVTQQTNQHTGGDRLTGRKRWVETDRLYIDRMGTDGQVTHIEAGGSRQTDRQTGGDEKTDR